MSLNEEDYIKSRPLLFEARPFARITKRNNQLQSTTPLSSSSSSTNTHAEIDLDFSYFSSAITRIQLQLTTSSREVSRYAAEKTRIESLAAEARETLMRLRESLLSSQLEKTNRLEYDRIAADILESTPRLKPRDEQHANIARLNEEIKDLEREREEYRKVWAARRAQFEEIVKQLEVMSAQIKEEKDEQDRRDGMSEGEEEEGEEVEGPTGAVKSGGATPAQSFVEEKVASRLGVPSTPAPGPSTPNVGTGATPVPVVDEKEEGEEDDDDVDLVDAPPMRPEETEEKKEGPDPGPGPERMDTS
ncbi:Tho complex subunit 7-domain-containing protein [Sphaerosporella brunnea]|uniref:Tho complex subunit 7-domain-containing protein n=1 Tax=Sphaerosporella brunnea TaxID=1250544 RepID=A0A5J5EPD8_9PEZI|nr:Tho complex subunit 7-domain-containing protein [Sphaerosporella brunnea]